MHTTQYISPIDSQSAHPNVSKRYKFVSTRDALEALTKQGFEIEPHKTRSRGGQYGLHCLTLTHPNLKPIKIGESLVQPRVMLKNSHDTSAAFGLIAGAYRFACFNGLVLGHGYAVRLIHTGDIQRDIAEALPKVFETVSKGLEAMSNWSNRQLSPAMILSLGLQSIDLRFSPEAIANLNKVEIAMSLTESNRPEDDSNDLFTVYNRIQERLIRGGFEYTVYNADGTISVKRVRKVYGIRATLTINQTLSNRVSELYQSLTKAG